MAIHLKKRDNYDTGVIYGLSPDITPVTTFDLPAGEMLIQDWSDPVRYGGSRRVQLSYPGATGITPDLSGLFVGLHFIENPSIPGVAQLIQTPNKVYDNLTRRGEVQLPVLFHDGAGNLVGKSFDKQLAYEWSQSIRDVQTAIGVVSEGNRIRAASTDLTITRMSGISWRMFFNSDADAQQPTERLNIEFNPTGFFYTLGGLLVSTPQTSLNTAQYDPDGLGVLANIPTNKFIVQVATNFGQSDTVSITHGQVVYNQQSDAESAIADGSFFTSFKKPINTIDGADVTYIIIKEGVTDNSLTANVLFVDNINAIIRNGFV